MIIGTGRMARLLARTFKSIAEVSITSPISGEAEKPAKKLRVKQANPEDAKDYDFILLAVSPLRLKEVALGIARHLKPGAVVMDISSVKKGFVEEVLEVLPSDVGYVSLHPLFGPSVKRIEKETVVVIPIRGEWATNAVLELVRSLGLRAVISSVEEHDKVMSIVQVAHHLSYLAYAMTLAKSLDLELIERYATRSLRYTLWMLKRMSKNLGVIREIQELNVYGQGAKAKLLENLKRLSEINKSAWRDAEEALKLLTSLKLN